MIQVLSGIQNTAAALDAERTRLDVIAENIANARTLRGEGGKPYQRQVVVFETAMQQALNANDPTASTLHVARIDKDNRPGEEVYDPGNPDADARGMIRLPNVVIHQEMADMIAASRAFEANLAVVKNARSMAMQTLAIGRR